MPLRIADMTPTERRVLAKALRDHLAALQGQADYLRFRGIAANVDPDIAAAKAMLAALGASVAP